MKDIDEGDEDDEEEMQRRAQDEEEEEEDDIDDGAFRFFWKIRYGFVDSFFRASFRLSCVCRHRTSTRVQRLGRGRGLQRRSPFCRRSKGRLAERAARCRISSRQILRRPRQQHRRLPTHRRRPAQVLDYHPKGHDARRKGLCSQEGEPRNPRLLSSSIALCRDR
jgi:hypothetical protein